MPDWKLIAQTRYPDIPPEAADRLEPVLEDLHQKLSRLLAGLPLETEPVCIYRLSRDDF